MRAEDISAGFKFRAEKTPETLAATVASTATIKLGAAATATDADVAAMATEDSAHGCCCSLMPFY